MKKCLLMLLSMLVSTVCLAEIGLKSVTPADGSTLLQMPDNITVEYTSNEGIGYGIWRVVDQNPEDENSAVIIQGQLKPNGEVWTAKVWYAEFMKLYAGHTYQLEIYPYASEEDSWYDSEAYENALTKLTANWTGATASFVYSDVTLVGVTPKDGSVIEAGDIKATFSAPVTVTSASINNGLMGDNIVCAVAANSDNTVWTIIIPQSTLESATGSLNLNVTVQDADGKVVKGNAGEENESCFAWTYNCYLGSPELDVTPASGSTVSEISKMTFSNAMVINLSYLTSEKITVMKDETLVATFDDAVVAEDNSYATATLPSPITEAGNYQVVIPTMYFMLGEEFSSVLNKKQVVTLTVNPATGISSASTEGSSVMYNLCGQRVSGLVKGIVIKDGKKYLR